LIVCWRERAERGGEEKFTVVTLEVSFRGAKSRGKSSEGGGMWISNMLGRTKEKNEKSLLRF
jgi:hypothetical protein